MPSIASIASIPSILSISSIRAPRGWCYTGVRMTTSEGEGLIPRHGGYRRLISFQLAQVVYDVTVRFCERYVARVSWRTQDQMVQAARSGVQNIAEGSQASGTSKRTELKLTNVARASLEELKLDYEDFLRQRQLELWPPDDPRRQELVQRRCQSADEVAAWVREVYRRDGQDGRDGRDGRNGQPADGEPSLPSIPSIPSISSIQSIRERAYAGLSANAALVLIGVACALLDRQLAAQGRSFSRVGGFSERLYRERVETRGRG